MKLVIEKEKPDLIILTGDSVSGSSIDKTEEGIKRFHAEWQKMVSPMKSAGIPWAMALGVCISFSTFQTK